MISIRVAGIIQISQMFLSVPLFDNVLPFLYQLH